MTIREASIDDIGTIQTLAHQTWWPAYEGKLSPEQISYMLSTLYSDEALHGLISSGTQRFLLLEADGVAQGFAAFGPRAHDALVYKLHKLYVLPENHGKGYGSKLIAHIIDNLRDLGVHILDLNVARFNEARHFYEKLGFAIIAEEDIPLGPYVLKDYVMRLSF